MIIAILRHVHGIINATTNPDTVQWSSPYLSKTSGEMVIATRKALLENGNLIGIIGLDIELTTITERVSARDIGYGGYSMVLDTEGLVIAHPESQRANWMDLPYIIEMYNGDNEQNSIHYEYQGAEYQHLFQNSQIRLKNCQCL